MLRRPAPGTLVVWAVALATGLALKAFYRHAGVEALGWILSPTVRLVEWSTGATFVPEPHVGYVSREHLFAIVPACAGVNFLVIAFCSLCLGFAGTCASAPARVALLPGSAVAAYATTIVANTSRIGLAMRLHDAGLSWGWLTAARLHEALGVAVYVTFLAVLFATVARLRVRGSPRGVAVIAVPWLVYVLVTIVMPVATGAGRTAGFAAHVVLTLGVSCTVAAGCALLWSHGGSAARHESCGQQ